MKLLQVVHQFPPRHVAGTEVYVESLSRALVGRGHRVAVFYGNRTPGEETRDGMRLRAVKGGLDASENGVASFFGTFGNPEIEASFSDLLQSEAPDVVHFHHLAGLPARLVQRTHDAGAAVIFTLHDYWFLCPSAQFLSPGGRICQGSFLGLGCGACGAERMRRPYLGELLSFLAAPLFLIRQRLVWRMLSYCDIIIAPSLFIRNMFIQRGLAADKITHLPLGIEVPQYLSTSRKTVQNEDRIAFVYVGSLVRQKGLHVLVEAFNKVDPAKAELRVYGDDSEYPEYVESLKRLARNDSIRFMGKLGRDSLWEALSAADVMVVPSLWFENFPLVVQEARAARLPVIASRIGAFQELVSDGLDGLLFEPGNAEDLADRIRLLVDEHEKIRELSGNAPQPKTMAEHAAEMEALYSQLSRKRKERQSVVNLMGAQ